MTQVKVPPLLVSDWDHGYREVRPVLKKVVWDKTSRIYEEYVGDEYLEDLSPNGYEIVDALVVE
ncbi:MAG: hypothetical protein WCY93_12200 [Anaerolineaceae bacterium]